MATAGLVQPTTSTKFSENQTTVFLSGHFPEQRQSLIEGEDEFGCFFKRNLPHIRHTENISSDDNSTQRSSVDQTSGFSHVSAVKKVQALSRHNGVSSKGDYFCVSDYVAFQTHVSQWNEAPTNSESRSSITVENRAPTVPELFFKLSNLVTTASYREPDLLRGKFKRTRFYRADKHRPYLTPAEALKCYGNPKSSVLTSYEKTEIWDFSRIYCVGIGAKKADVTESAALNHGMDRADGRYDARLKDHIAYRYEILKILGKGNSSHVLQAYDHQEKRTVALKIFRNRKRFNKMGLVELELTKKLDQLDSGNIHNLIRFYGAFYFRRHLIISTELLAGDLLRFIRERSEEDKEISRDEICRFTGATLRALAFLDENNIVHLDVKPENLLLKDVRDVGTVKLVDFGSARVKNQHATEDYIQTRYYRAPEVIFAQKDLDSKVDIWSFGCVLAELHMKGLVLLEGDDESEQLAKMIEMFGTPPSHLLTKWRESQKWRIEGAFDVFGRHFRKSHDSWVPVYLLGLEGRKKIGKPGSKRLNDTLNLHSHSRLSTFLSECLQWDPRQRMSAKQALEHELLQ